MADININPNLGPQQNLPADQIVRRKAQTPGLIQSFTRAIKRPIEYVRYWVSPCESPADTLRRIDEAADRGIQRAKNRGVALEPVAPRLHGALDQVLGTQANAERAAALDAAQRGVVADVGPLMPDEEVTRAPLLQDRVDATDWKEEIKVQRDTLSSKLSAFTALLQMRDSCGKVDDNNLALMDLVKRATEGANPPTIWELFTQHYDLSFFEFIQAAWTYWFYYKTSLITNTVNAYLGSFIDNLTKDLTTENSETRTKLFRGLLQNTNQFLIADIQATKDFAFEKDHGDLEDYRNRAIERHYGFSLSELCRSFSERRVEESSPQVVFFKDFQEIPIIKWAFKAFQWFVNRVIIQRSMKSWILPKALESAVNKGLEATQPHNLPFSLSLTRFFTQRLEQLRIKLDTPGSKVAKPDGKFPGTEALPETIKYLKLALALEDAKTPLELRRKFQEIEKDKGWGLKPTIAQALEKSIVESSDLLFRYLDETAQSGELFARLLELSIAPFSGVAKDQAILQAEYKEEKSKLERTAQDVFKRLVSQGVSEVFNGGNTQDSNNAANESFDDQRVIATKSTEELSEICTRMALKIEQSREAPTPENNVQSDIASFLQIMQVLASRKELQEELKSVKGVDQNAIWRVLTPLFERAERIQERVLNLQELQDHYPSHAAVVLHLNEMRDLMRSIREQFHAQPRHLQTPLIQSLGKTADDITKCLGAKAPLRIRLQQFIVEISQLSESIVKEQQAIDAIHKLYPPRNHIVEEDSPEGLLDQMLNYERGIHPRGFKPQACMAEIGKYLAHFPPAERGELERIIGNGSNLRTKWTALGAALQGIYARHAEAKNRDKALLDQTLDASTNWVQEKTVKYNLVKQDDHNKMRAEMGAISAEVAGLKRDVSKMELNLSTSLSPRVSALASLATPIALGAAGFTPWLTIPLSLVGGGFGKWMHGVGGSNDSGARSIAKKVAIVGAGAAAAYLGWVPAATTYLSGFVPAGLSSTVAGLVPAGVSAAVAGWVPERIASVGGSAAASLASGGGSIASYLASSQGTAAATVAYTGWSGLKVFNSNTASEANDQVWELFTNAHRLSLAPRVYKAATTRAMKALSE